MFTCRDDHFIFKLFSFRRMDNKCVADIYNVNLNVLCRVIHFIDLRVDPTLQLHSRHGTTNQTPLRASAAQYTAARARGSHHARFLGAETSKRLLALPFFVPNGMPLRLHAILFARGVPHLLGVAATRRDLLVRHRRGPTPADEPAARPRGARWRGRTR